MIEPIRIELPLDVMFNSVNCYLIPGKQLTLVDCGLDTGDNWKNFQNQLKKQGYLVSDLEQIVLTHEHRDHIGLLSKIMAASKATVRAPKAIEGWFRDPETMKVALLNFLNIRYRLLGFPENICQKALQFISNFRSYPRIEEMDRFEFFEEGDLIEMANTQWEAVNTPGHCPSQFVFIQEAEQRILSGDMLLPITTMPIVSEDPDNPGQANRALKELLDSYARLKPFDFQKVYPGHGAFFTNANKVIDHQLARIEKRKAQCLTLYQAGHKTVYDIHQKMYPNHKMPPNFSGIHMIQGYLDLLFEEQLIPAPLYQPE